MDTTATSQASYPRIAGNYTGRVHNTTYNVWAYASFSFLQNQQNIGGSSTMYSPLIGSGQIVGTITRDGYVQFVVRDYLHNIALSYAGNIVGNTLQGTYTTSNGEQGTWSIP